MNLFLRVVMDNTRAQATVPSPLRTVGEHIKLGNYLASNKQWSNAIVAFSEALGLMVSSVFDGASLGAVPGLRDALYGLGTNSVAASEAPAAFQQLRKAQQKASGLDLGAAPFIGAFPCPDGERFVVIHHDETTYTLGELKVTIPTGKSFSFLVTPNDEDVLSAPLTPLETRQFSYIVAHRGWAWATSTMLQYYQGATLLDYGIPAISSWATHYHFALRLNPANDWALAHLAEVYRDFANGWPGSIDTLTMPHERVNDYVRSLVLFQAAIDINPRAFWAHAHLGAAIVNVRAFAGPLENTAQVPPALAALLEMWSGRSQDDDSIDNDIAFIEKAILVLTTALELTNNYYPWAEAYHADALLIKALVLGSKAPDHLGLLGMLGTITACWLDPRLLTAAIAPGGLVESGYFSPAMVSYFAKQPALAWQYACLGMATLFRDHFIPGLPELVGIQLLANIAVEHIQQLQEGRAAAPDSSFPRRNIPDWIPLEPISTNEGLIGFIETAATHLFRSFVRFWLGKDIILNTSVHTSLLQSQFIFVDLNTLLRGLEEHAAGPLIEQLDGFILEIGKKLNHFPNDQNHVPTHLQTYSNGSHDMISTFYSGTPSYHMSAAIAKIKQG